MRLVDSSQAKVVANPRISKPFMKLKAMRFPTTKEIQATWVELPDDTTEELSILDRLFPESETLASEIEMYVTRHDAKGYVGMTFPHQLETRVRTFDRGAKVDIAKASWAPIHFKEGKAWGERQMLEMGKLIPEVQETQINGEIAEFLAMMKKRTRNRIQWMKHSVLRRGKIVFDNASPDNPDKIRYDIDYGVTNLELSMPIKIDAKDGEGRSLVDPVKWITDINRAAKFTGKKIVKIVVNSNFVDYLTDNTFIREGIDYETGRTTLQAVDTPRYIYGERALAYFQKFTKVAVEFNDQVYEDDAGQQHYYFPDGEALLLYGNDGPVGNFVFTGHVQPGAGDGTINISTGTYAYAVDRTKDVMPMYELISGFSGLPQLKGYDPIDFTYERFKWVKFAEGEIQNPPLPKRPDIGAPIV